MTLFFVLLLVTMTQWYNSNEGSVLFVSCQNFQRVTLGSVSKDLNLPVFNFKLGLHSTLLIDFAYSILFKNN